MADVGITFAGTEISISAGAPATYTKVGFEALTFTPIGEITTAVGSGGRTYEDVSYVVINDRATKHRKGTYDEAEQTVEMVVVRDDAGQVLCNAALDSDNYYAFKVEYNNGEIDYFTGLVIGFEGEGGDANTMRMATLTMRRNYQGTVSVAAP